jgi:hypothetical protein
MKEGLKATAGTKKGDRSLLFNLYYSLTTYFPFSVE